ncbi:MAG TPA: hypothetical protein P5287_01315 [bacterium]|nr:hypothetical protein [bacterium]
MMRKLLLLFVICCSLSQCGCESLYYSLAMDKPVYGKDDKDKFDRDAPDMVDRVNKYR